MAAQHAPLFLQLPFSGSSAAILVLLAVLFLVAVLHARASFATGGIISYAGWLPFMGMAIPFGRDSMELLMRLGGQHAGIFRLLLAGERRIFMTNPADFYRVWSNPAFSMRPFGNAVVACVTGMPVARIASVDDSEVKDLFVRHLQGKSLALRNREMASILLQECIRPELAGDADWRVVPLSSWSNAHLLCVGARMIFGPTFDVKPVQMHLPVFDEWFPLLLAGVPRMFLPAAMRARDALFKAVHAHLQRGTEGMSALMLERNAHMAGQGFNDVEMAAINVTIVWTLHVNTAATLFWTLAYAIADMRANAAIMAEVDALFARDVTWWLHPDTLSSSLDGLANLTSTMWEALRMSSASGSARTPLHDTSITLKHASESGEGKTYQIAAGEPLVMVGMHHFDPLVFADPHAFKYDRFMPLPDGSPRPFKLRDGTPLPLRAPVFAFGGGDHMCPGRFVAMNEVRLMAAMLLRYFEWDAPRDVPLPKPNASRMGLGIMPPIGYWHVRMRPRPGVPLQQ